MSKREYKTLCEKLRTRDLMASLENPTKYMNKIHIAIHKIVLRNRQGA